MIVWTIVPASSSSGIVDRLDARPERAQLVDRRLRTRRRPSGSARSKSSVDDADPEPARTAVRLRPVRGREHLEQQARSPRRSSRSARPCRSVQETGTTPSVGTRPVDGRSPVTPQKQAGIRIEPAVSVPSVPGTRSAATAAPLPPLEPPQMRSSDHGFRAGPKCGLVVVAPKANSCVFSLPSTTAPAARRRATAVGVTPGDVVAENPRRCGRARARDVDHVLDRDRHPVQRAVGRVLGLGERLLGADRDEGVELAGRLDPLEIRLHRLTRGELARPESRPLAA